MPRYFFSLQDHVVEIDDVGVELPDVASARSEAIRFAGEMLHDEPELLAENKPLRVWVTDETGGRPFQLTIQASGTTLDAYDRDRY